MRSLNSTFIFSRRENLIKRLELKFSKFDLNGAILDIKEYISDFPTEKELSKPFKRNGTFLVKMELSKLFNRNEQKWNYLSKSGNLKTIQRQ